MIKTENMKTQLQGDIQVSPSIIPKPIFGRGLPHN